MYWTHHFAHEATLNRAHAWLVQLGYTPDRMQVHAQGVPRLSLAAAPSEIEEIKMLIHAVERTDPEGWPSFWDEARLPHAAPHPAEEPANLDVIPRSATVIGWHPPD